MPEKIRKAVWRFIRNTDKMLLLFCSIATMCGLVMVYSANYTEGVGLSAFYKQLAVFIFGTVLALVISLADYHTIGKLWPVWAILSILLVLLTFTPLGLIVAGTDDRAWINIPLIGSFQPSELMKPAFILTFSLHLSKVRDHINHPLTLLLLGVHALVPIVLVFLQGDDGTALVFLVIVVVMIFSAGLHWAYLLSGAIAILSVVPILWTHLDDSKKGRFLCLFLVDQYAKTEGWQQMQSVTGIGSGRLTGVGFLNGNAFYARNNDFIFTIAGEEFGFLGAMGLILVLLLIMWALWRASRHAMDDQGSFICIGMLGMIAAQTIINIGMNLRVLPTIGITLPFISAGGSSLACLYIAVGIALSVTHTTRKESHSAIFNH